MSPAPTTSRRSPRRRTSSSGSPRPHAGRTRTLWTPRAEQAGRELVRASPAGLAFVHSGGLDPDASPGTLWLPADHLLLIAARVVAVVAEIRRVQDAIARGELPPDAQGPRLMVFMPPRHGKSELISRYTPAWFLGTNPELRVMLASYGAALANGWGRKARDLIEEVGTELYDVQLDPASARADAWDLDGHRGGMKTAGVGGAITGMGAHLFIVDDPVKDAADAASEVMQDNTWDWWQGTARTRLMPGAGVVVLQTRWHELDLSGRLLAEDPHRDKRGRLLPEGERRDDVDGEEWDVLCLPAESIDPDADRAAAGDGYGGHDELGRTGAYIDVPIPNAPEDEPQTRREWRGEALWSAMYPLHQLRRIAKAVGRYVWSAQFQQTPTPAEGGIFKRADFRYMRQRGDLYELLDDRMQHVKTVGKAWCYHFATADTALSEKETADYTVLARWAVTPDYDLLLLDVERHHFEQPEVEAFLIRTRAAWAVNDLRVEATAHGLALWQGLVRRGEPVRKLDADTDKVVRAMGAVPRYEANTVFHRLGAPWLDEYERELLAFPNGAHDDQVDTFAYAALALPSINLSQRRREEPDVRTETGGLLDADL